ncbi:RNA-binding protein, putative [Plasmodium berghei]|uniref:RNA-binding protein, putative n=2 Tax=Plasmodium berghei TaxID=5821 RepID=A0A509AKD0_PLABA|nr:RNA-binding protein, putative [Plasmodium berghei ANKA]CXI26486.1 RNA-binding protein, putative [Plasmodium berghei]SCM20504.1 RNA-binding protein, putative [Plasmodium berghei]SCN24082.1 RNA-binding protein, putative [Plasmodium berghei]SCO59387.1 RNA-binding protein, putative [Plasmodium berghei]SCO60564.1 RNA-binding protein, putative [Plasmodium berghei]|eukprot:XP_034420924.1 RNA-binding protein, putative [Plasmodium berghei ANKA]
MSSKMETPKDLSEMTDSDFSNIDDKTDEKNEDEKKNKMKVLLKKPKKKLSISSKTSQKNNKKVIQNKTKKKINGPLACPPPPTHPPPPPPPPFIPKEKQQNWKLKKQTNNPDINNDIISMSNYPNNINNNPHYRINESQIYNKSLSIGSVHGPTPPYTSNIYNHGSGINSLPCTNTNIKVNLQTNPNYNYNNSFKKNYKMNNISESELYVVASPTLMPAPTQQTNNPINIQIERKHTLISNNSINKNKDYPYMDIQHNNNNFSFPSNTKQQYSNISIPPNPNYYQPNNLRPTDYIEDKIYYPNYQNNTDHNNAPKYYQPVINTWNGAAHPPIPNNPYHGNPKTSTHDYNSEKINYKDKPIRMGNGPYDTKPHNIIVTNIPKNLTSRDIMETFKCMGNVLGAGIMMTSKGEHSGCAYVTFPNIETAALAASRYDGGTLNNQKIKVFIE